MIRTSQLRQRVDVVKQVPAGRDERNNAVTAPTHVRDVPATVEVKSSTETEIEEDRTVRLYDVILPGRWHDVSMALDADDSLVYEGLELQLLGMAVVVRDGLGRVDHVEIEARSIAG